MLEEAYDIEFKELFMAIIRRWYIVLALMIGIAAILTYFKGGKVVTYYETSTRIIVGNTVENQGSSYNIDEIAVYQGYINTYMEMLKTDMVLGKTVDLLSFNTSSSVIKANLSTVAGESTQFFDIYLTWDNRQQAIEVLTTLTDTFIKEMQKTYPDVNLRIMDQVKTPIMNSTGTPKRYTCIIGAVIGGILAMLIIFALEFLDNTVKGEHEVEGRLKSYLLATIPKQKKEIKKIDLKKSTIVDSYFLEAYRRLRVNLIFLNQREHIKSVIVTSGEANEGKSTVAMMLGISMALSGQKTIVVEGDLRWPKLEQTVKLERNVGMIEVLMGTYKVHEVIQQTAIENLALLSAGKANSDINVAELLCEEKLAEMIRELEADYDYIIIDTPPINVVSDAQSLTWYVDGIILVARYRKTKYKDLERAKYYIEHIGGRVLGIVINKKEDYQREKRYALYHSRKVSKTHSQKTNRPIEIEV